jgi:hypothetical protein
MTRKIAGNQEAAFAVLVSEGAVIIGKGTKSEGKVIVIDPGNGIARLIITDHLEWNFAVQAHLL